MIELFYSLSFVFLLILSYIAYKDYQTKLISLWSFYLLNIVGLLWLYFFDDGVAKYLMFIYFFIIFLLDILEMFDKLPSFISSDWMIGETGIYDYWVYLFIVVLFIDFLTNNFLYYYIGFTISLILGAGLAYLLTKKRYKKHIPLFSYAFFIILFMIITIFILK